MPWDVELISPSLANLWNISQEDAENQIYSNFIIA
jgi:hypothetical protein